MNVRRCAAALVTAAGVIAGGSTAGAQYLPAPTSATPKPLLPVDVTLVGTPFANPHAGEPLEFDVRVDNHGQPFDAQSFRLDRGPKSNWTREYEVRLRDLTSTTDSHGIKTYHVVIPRGVIGGHDVHRFTYYFVQWPKPPPKAKPGEPQAGPGGDYDSGELASFHT